MNLSFKKNPSKLELIIAIFHCASKFNYLLNIIQLKHTKSTALLIPLLALFFFVVVFV